MWPHAATLAQTLWQLLPELTIALRFLTAMIGFVVATLVLARRATHPRVVTHDERSSRHAGSRQQPPIAVLSVRAWK